jgi:hypothetical protein
MGSRKRFKRFLKKTWASIFSSDKQSDNSLPNPQQATIDPNVIQTAKAVKAKAEADAQRIAAEVKEKAERKAKEKAEIEAKQAKEALSLERRLYDSIKHAREIGSVIAINLINNFLPGDKKEVIQQSKNSIITRYTEMPIEAQQALIDSISSHVFRRADLYRKTDSKMYSEILDNFDELRKDNNSGLIKLLSNSALLLQSSNSGDGNTSGPILFSQSAAAANTNNPVSSASGDGLNTNHQNVAAVGSGNTAVATNAANISKVSLTPEDGLSTEVGDDYVLVNNPSKVKVNLK